jgi:sugar/nucleoside kinase (ribokinase family)
MQTNSIFDIVVIGNFTRDTIVSPSGTRMVDGGGFNYGAHVAAMMGLRTAAVTRLAKEDSRVVDALVRLGVTVFPVYTPHSTTLRLYYPTSNPDERVLSVTQTAGAFTPEQVRDLQSKVFLINGSIRGEVDLDVIRELKAKDTLLAADVQGFVRVVAPDGTLVYAPWPEKEQVLSHIDIVKTDAVEAEMLTGTADIKAAAEIIASWGPREVVLTHRDGLLVLARVGQAGGQFHQAPFCPRQLVGRSGRGDTCVASYVAKRLTAPPQEACIWAAAVTSLKLEAEGPIKKTVADVEELIERVYARL